jgi:cell division transport system permease protein
MRAKFVLTEATTGLWRNVTMTIAMILTTMVSLFLLGLGGITAIKVADAKDLLFVKVEVTIFLTEDVTEQQRSDLSGKLKSDGLVQSVEHESKEQAYQRFKQLFKDTPDLVDNVKPDALPESFRVKLKDPTKFDEIKKRYGSDPGVYRVQDQQAVLGNIFDTADAVEGGVLFIAGLVGFAGLLLIGNMVQIAAYSRRREISIMKLVGASNWYVRLPFILEVSAAAVIGAILAEALLVIGRLAFVDHLIAPLFKTGIFPKPEWSLVLWTGPVLAVAAVAVSALAGWITLRFRVKV